MSFLHTPQRCKGEATCHIRAISEISVQKKNISFACNYYRPRISRLHELRITPFACASEMKISSKLHASGELKFSSAQPTLLSRRRLADHASVTMRYPCNPRHPCEIKKHSVRKKQCHQCNLLIKIINENLDKNLNVLLHALR